MRLSRPLSPSTKTGLSLHQSPHLGLLSPAWPAVNQSSSYSVTPSSKRQSVASRRRQLHKAAADLSALALELRADIEGSKKLANCVLRVLFRAVQYSHIDCRLSNFI